MSYSLSQWIALLCMVAVAALFVAEARRWRSLEPVIGRRHRLLRVGIVLLLETLLLMVFFGPIVAGRKDPIGEVIYWTICIVVGLAVILLALLDLREVGRDYISESRRMFRDLEEGERRDDK